MNGRTSSLVRHPRALPRGAGGLQLLIGVVVLATVLGGASAEAPPLAPVTTNGDPAAAAAVSVTTPPDVQTGERLANQGRAPAVLACVTCHGVKGEGVGVFPPLAGAGQAYLQAQLDALADGSRQNVIMGPIAKAMSAAERAATAAYFSTLPYPLPAAAPTGKVAKNDEGAWLVERGRWSDHIPACVQCHGPAGEGVGAHFPPIAPLNARYMQDQIQAWKDGSRPPGPLGLMQVLAKKLSSDDLAAVAAYFEKQRSPAATSATGVQDPAPQRAAAASSPSVPTTPVAAKSLPTAAPLTFVAPNAREIPDTPMGDMIRRGEQIFVNTRANAPRFVGNALNCVNCHLDAGRLAGSAPMWGAYPLYPAYRNKTKHVDTFAERLRGCFMYSMNGRAPPEGSDVLIALEAYSYWMARGAPIGEKLPGSGYPKVPKPAQDPDLARGHAVFEAKCALCHGADGQGQRVGDTEVFPPLWGPQSYNWGAGMHEVDKAAAFIKANMPLGLGGSLSDQEAWDVAKFLNSHERPQDPRFTGDIAQTRQKFHDSEFSLYGTTVNGRLLGAGVR